MTEGEAVGTILAYLGAHRYPNEFYTAVALLHRKGWTSKEIAHAVNEAEAWIEDRELVGLS